MAPTQGPDRGGVLPSSVFFFSDAMGVLETSRRSCSHQVPEELLDQEQSVYKYKLVSKWLGFLYFITLN